MPTFPLKKRNFEGRLRQLHDQLLEVLDGKNKLYVEGEAFTAAEIAARLAGTLAKFDAVRAAKAAWLSALTGLHADLGTASPFLRSVGLALRSQLGSTHPGIRLLGLTPKLRRKLTPAQKTLKAEKMKLTRKARGLLGKRQRLALKAPR